MLVTRNRMKEKERREERKKKEIRERKKIKDKELTKEMKRRKLEITKTGRKDEREDTIVASSRNTIRNAAR